LTGVDDSRRACRARMGYHGTPAILQKGVATRGRYKRTSYARVYGIYDKHRSIMVDLDTHDLGVKRKMKDTREWTKSGEIGVYAYAMLLRDVGYAVSVECTFCRLLSKRRKRLRRKYDKSKWKEKRLGR